MRRILAIVLCVVFCADFVIGANNVVLNCTCELKNNCFKPLELSSVNETGCVDDNFVRCCSVSEPHITKVVIISSSTSVKPKPKSEDVIVVYPSEMSGIPQTTPVNMPDDYMIKMIDRESGYQMLLVFPKHEKTASEVPTTTTTSTTATATTATSTTPSTTTTTELISITEIPASLPASSTAAPEGLSTTEKSKPIWFRRRKTNRNNNNHADQKQVTPKPNVKIYDVSNRHNYLRRQPNTPQESNGSVTPRTTQPVAVERPFNNELRMKVDEEHKMMIESLKALLASNNHTSVRSSTFEILKNARIEMVNTTRDSIKTSNIPFRGKIKYQDNKWAAIPDRYQEQQTSSRTTTERPSTTRSTITRRPITDRRKNRHNFRPSPQWSLKDENIDIVEINTRVPRTYQASKLDYVEAKKGFVPLVNNGEALQIVGHVPRGFKQRTDDTRLNYELPSQP